jgi:hypothetical protein
MSFYGGTRQALFTSRELGRNLDLPSPTYERAAAMTIGSTAMTVWGFLYGICTGYGRLTVTRRRLFGPSNRS